MKYVQMTKLTAQSSLIRKAITLMTLGFCSSLALAGKPACKAVNALVTEAEPPLTCPFDLCSIGTNKGTLGPGEWHTGLNLTDVAPPPKPLAQGFVLVGSAEFNFIHQSGDVLYGGFTFAAAPNNANVSGAVYLFDGGTGRFEGVTGAMVDVKLQDESKFRLKGELCGLN